MLARTLYYAVKPLIPRSLQLTMRRRRVQRQRRACADRWPIDRQACVPPPNWPGWPDQKRFAVILTHDVESAYGHDKCTQLMELETEHGFRSSFNFVPERYKVSEDLRAALSQRGFEVGVHGLNHDGKLYSTHKTFQQRAKRINHYLRDWNAVGFRSPAMHHNLDWLHDLNITYDASTFDTGPFEAQPDGTGTIFPFWVSGPEPTSGYLELPYTLPQDFTLFVLMQEANIKIWTEKVDWIAANGGMVLVNAHPDYMHFGPGKLGPEEYSSNHYAELLDYLHTHYEGQFWHGLPKTLTEVWRQTLSPDQTTQYPAPTQP